jgi:hypothetical protein
MSIWYSLPILLLFPPTTAWIVTYPGFTQLGPFNVLHPHINWLSWVITAFGLSGLQPV